MDFNTWLAAAGFNPETITDIQRTALQTAWRASVAGDEEEAPEPTPAPAAAGDVDTHLAATLATARAKQAKKKAVMALVAKYATEDPDKLDEYEKIATKALSGEYDTIRCELEMLRVSRGSGPMGFVKTKPEANNEVIIAALCKQENLKNIDKHFADKTLDTADRLYSGGLGLQELIGICASANGFRGNVGRNLNSALKAAFANSEPFDMRADVGPSTLNISGILGNTANKFSKEAFEFVENEWEKISDIQPVKDFKTITTYSLTGDLDYKEIPAGGLLEHGTLGETSYTNRAKTYGRLLGIDRTQIVNDDLSALSQVPRRLGRGGATKINEVFWKAFLNNSGFFKAANGNATTGTGTAFSNDGLTAADVIWRGMTDPDGNPMGTTATILLVPPALRIPALRLMSSQSFGESTSEEGNNNPWAGMFEVVSSRYMNNASYTGNSDKAWYFLCDPRDIAVIQVVFLNGQRFPTINTVDMEVNRLGIAMQGYHDFGVAFQEPRGGHRFKGEN